METETASGLEVRQQAEWPLTLPEERQNVLRLMGQCLEMGAHDQVVATWDALSGDLWERGYWGDYIKGGIITLRAAQALHNDVVEAHTYNEIGWAHMERQDWRLARMCFEEALKVYRRLNDIGSQSTLLRDLGTLALRRDRPGSALRFYDKAMQIVKRGVDRSLPDTTALWVHREAEIHNLAGSVYSKLYEFAISERELLSALRLYRSLGESHKYYQAAPLLNLGRLYYFTSDYKQSRANYEECRQLSLDLKRIDTLAGALFRLAELAEVEGDKPGAIRLTMEAQRVSGSEVVATRERATRLRERIAGSDARKPLIPLSRLCRLGAVMLDVLLYSPTLAFRTLMRYMASGARGW